MIASLRFRVWGCALTCCVILSGRAAGQEDSRQGIVDADVVALESHIGFEHVIVGADGVTRAVAGDDDGMAGAGERLIYSNTLGIQGVNFPSNQPVSDDIATTAPNGCALKRYRFKVLGRVLSNSVCLGGSNFNQPCTSSADCPGGTCSLPDLGSPYTVTYGLYTQCPLAVGSSNAARDLVKIPGTEGTLDFPDDGPRLIEHIVPAGTPVALPTNVYLGIRFDRGNCGTVIGAPASIGYSGDIWDFPGFPCNGFLGGFPELPHASFWLEMFGTDNCANAFVVYKAQRPSGGIAALGANIQGVDDVKLIVNECQMIGYEVVVKGVGFYTFDLRRECDGQIIAGTERTFSVNASTVPLLQVARFAFDPPITLTTDSIFLGFKSSSNSSGAVITGIPPIIGSSGTDYFDIGVDGCTPLPPTQGVHGAVNLAITCAGSLPLGACCDPYLTECAGGADPGKRCLANSDCTAPGTCEAVCRQTTELNCPFPPLGQELRPQWQMGEACEPDPFLPNACGVAACCHKKPHPQNPNVLEDVCENLTKNDCESAPPLDELREWQLGQYCGVDVQECGHGDCLAREGSCYVAHDTPGCSDPFCCSEVCSHGAEGLFCCNTAWDSACVALAESHCSQQFGNQCAPNFPVRGMEGALAIPVPGSRAMSNLGATTDPGEPGFCCHNGVGTCIGGDDPGAPCIVDADCPATKSTPPTCSPRMPTPDGKGYGTIWFKFVQPQGLTTAGISTCNSISPALDSVVQVFAATDQSSQLAACNSLVPIGCNDDAINCGSLGRNSRVCLRDLTPGATYYIMVAAKTPNRQGQYIVTVSTSCSGPTPSCTHCPAGEVVFVNPPDGVVDARRTHDRNNLAEGIEKVVVEAPAGASKGCWTVCAGGFPAQDLIVHIEEDPPGLYTLYFSRPISAGDATLITYAKDQAFADTGRFFFHPGNVNADAKTNPNDILELVDHLNGVKSLPWGLFSGDLDYSGVIGPADIITLIDLLNGANGYGVWYGTTLPDAVECP